MTQGQDRQNTDRTKSDPSASAQKPEPSKPVTPQPGGHRTTTPEPTHNSDRSKRVDNGYPEGDWDVMEQELAAWGRHLDQLRARAHVVGSEVIQDLETRYDEVTRQAEALRKKAETQAREARKTADEASVSLSKEARSRLKDMQDSVAQSSEQAKENLNELSAKAKAQSEAAAETIKETSEKLWIGAQEMGEGFRNAWVEMRKALENASHKMQEKDGAPDKNRES